MDWLAQILQAVLALVQGENAILTQLKTITPSLMQGSAVSGITARAGGGQANATQLTAQMNQVATVASSADSVKLLPSSAGLWQDVANAGANPMQLFGTGADTINGAAAATGISIAAGKSAHVFCPVVGKWYAVVSA